MIRLLILLLVTLLFLAGCKKVDTLQPANKELFGEWKYIHQGGGFGGVNQSMDGTRTIEFKENGKVIQKSDGDKVDKGEFRFTDQKCIHGGHPNITGTIALLQKGEVHIYSSFIVSNDTLQLIDEVVDGMWFTLVKK